MTYEEMTGFIESMPKFADKKDLSGVEELMKELCRPDRRIKVIHVAGSNGKGSVCAMVNQVLLEAGKTVGMFTSPHLLSVRERFLVNGRKCTTEEFSEAFIKVKEAAEHLEKRGVPYPVASDFLFAMAMVLFSEKKLEYAILETGLGGRLDATNIVEEPLLSVLTSISLEHTQYLGNTVEAIAAEKAGIIKEGCGVVFDGSDRAVSAVIRKHAAGVHAPFYEVLPEQLTLLKQNGKRIDFSYQCRYDVSVEVEIPFPAEYQMMNAAVAYKVSELLQSEGDFGRDIILKGLKNSRWPGRMQEAAPGIYLDGAHNPAGVQAFLQTVEQIGGKNPLLLFAVAGDKDYKDIVKRICSMEWGEIILTELLGQKSVSAEVLAEEFMRYGRETALFREPKEAYRYAEGKKQTEQKLFCAGSLYLIRELEKLTGGRTDD